MTRVFFARATWCVALVLPLACGEAASPTPDQVAGAGSGGVAGTTSGEVAGAGGTVTAAGQANGGTAPIAAGTSGGPGAGGGAGSSGGTSTGSAGSEAGGGASSSGTGGSGGSASGNAGAGGSGGAGGTAPFGVCTKAPAKAVTIYMIGDSTMSVYASNLYPRMGWGQPLGDSFAPQCATVVDKALSGRSSKSFYDEGAWTPIKSALKAGDYVLIQFGHNDEKSDEPTLYTDPQTTYKQFLTTYVTDTRAKSATPLLLTSINRNKWSGTTLSDTHGAYPAAVRELAASLKVELIDLTALSKTYFERIGQTETNKLFLMLSAGQFPNYPDGVTDTTHFQEKGAIAIGQLAMANAYAQKLTIASYLKAVPVAP
ncbi:MAG: rhamnogalacturonan acetylesterase [Myxococcales bacterium]